VSWPAICVIVFQSAEDSCILYRADEARQLVSPGESGSIGVRVSDEVGGKNAMRARGKLLSTAVVAAGMTVFLVGGGLAQDATPTAGNEYAPYAAHLHQGTCAEPSGEPVAVLAQLELPSWVGELASGQATAINPADFGNAPIPVAVSTTEVSVPITDIVSGKHALTVELSDPNNPEDDVACGDIGGVVDENGDLFVGLDEANGSGHNGVAWLHDNSGTSTTVVVFLAHPEEKDKIEAALAGMPAATPMATTSGGAVATPVMGAATPTA
jgi:hypothetical protein